MKNISFSYVLSLFTFLIMYPVLSFAQVKGQYPNEAIAGVDKLWIDIQADNNDIVKYSVPLEKIREKSSEKLKSAGLIIKPDPLTSSFAEDHKMPSLVIQIDIMDLKTSPSLILFTRISLSRIVSLEQKSETFIFRSDVWERKSIIESVPNEEVQQRLTDAILKQVEYFIADWSAANIKVVDHNTAVQVKTLKKETPKISEQQNSEGKFVASKNGKVFHKPDCQFVARISAENLVSYDSKEEAIAAGKHPCKRCNP